METKKYPARHFIRIKAAAGTAICYTCAHIIALGSFYWYNGRQTYCDNHRPTDGGNVLKITCEEGVSVASR